MEAGAIGSVGDHVQQRVTLDFREGQDLVRTLNQDTTEDLALDVTLMQEYARMKIVQVRCPRLHLIYNNVR